MPNILNIDNHMADRVRQTLVYAYAKWKYLEQQQQTSAITARQEQLWSAFSFG
jgi:hypothetical protein